MRAVGRERGCRVAHPAAGSAGIRAPWPPYRYILRMLTLLLLLLSGVRAEPPSPALRDSEALASARSLGTAFADLAVFVEPATVRIEAERTMALSKGLDQLMRDFALPRDQAIVMQGSATGSGVIVKPDGLILTNHHVVGGATRVMVTLHDKRSYPALVLGTDARTDVAVVQLQRDPDEGPLPWVAMGDSDALRVGEWVVAVGHPFEFAFSVTAGIVSARGRRGIADDEIQDYIQTDAAVNPGSSGGPLFNLDGEVIGINTAIFSPGGASNAGIAFAIPSNMAWRVARELLDSGRVARATLGVETVDRPPSLDNPRPGAEVVRVFPDGPAEEVGLRRGDVVIAFGDEPVADAAELRGMVLAAGAGSAHQLRWERGDSIKEAEVTTRDARELAMPEGPPPEDGRQWGGMVLAPPTAERVARFGVVGAEEGELPGLIVLSVAPASPAAVAGIAPGDLVMEVGRVALESVDHLDRLRQDRRTATLTIWRDGTSAVAVLAGLERE